MIYMVIVQCLRTKVSTVRILLLLILIFSRRTSQSTSWKKTRKCREGSQERWKRQRKRPRGKKTSYFIICDFKSLLIEILKVNKIKEHLCEVQKKSLQLNYARNWNFWAFASNVWSWKFLANKFFSYIDLQLYCNLQIIGANIYSNLINMYAPI